MKKIFESEKAQEISVEIENHEIRNSGRLVTMAFLPFFTGHDCEPMWSLVHFSWVVLYIRISEELWDEIAEVEEEKGMMLPENFESYVGESYDGHISPCWGYTNNVDDELIRKCVYARDLKGFAGHPGMMEGSESRAAWAYLEHCADGLRIALYWS